MKPFEQYLRLLLELHVLFDNGEEDSEHADYLRDQMDTAWYQLTDKEMDILSSVSTALYGDCSGETS